MNDTTPAIRPFVAAVPDEAIDDLKARLARTRWPDPQTSRIGRRAFAPTTSVACCRGGSTTTTGATSRVGSTPTRSS